MLTLYTPETASETDYSDLDVDLSAKSDSDASYIANSELAEVDGFGSGTTHISGHLIADQDDDNNNNNGVADKIQPRLFADSLSSTSPAHASVTYQASRQRSTADIKLRRMDHSDLDVTMESEGEGHDVFAELDDEDNVDTRCMKRSMLSADSYDDPAFDSDVCELQDDQHDCAESPQLGAEHMALAPPVSVR